MNPEEFYEGIRPESVFLALAALFGLLFLFLTPPIQVPDEDVHLFRAYHLAEGNLRLKRVDWKKGMFLPASLVEMTDTFRRISFHPELKVTKEEILAQLNTPLQPKNKVFVQKDNFSPLPYFPQTAGVFIGKLFGASPLKLMYMGRFFNFLVWMGLVFLSVRLMPTFKWVFCLLALTPMSLFEGASLSYDAFTNGISFLWIALIFHATYRKSTLNGPWIFLLILVSILVTMSKNVYVFLFLLFLLIPSEKFSKPRDRWLWFTLISVLNLLLSALWIQKFIHFNFLLDSGLKPTLRQVQIMKALGEPWAYLSIVFKTLQKDFVSLIKQFLGVLGWLDTPLPQWFYPLCLSPILLASISEKNSDVTLSSSKKAVLFHSFCLSSLLIFLSMYVTITSARDRFVAGVQGRYFIPIAPLLFLLLYNRDWIRPLKNSSRIFPAVAVFFCILSSLTALYSIWKRYYGV